jgi:hypothetical protein
MKTILVLLLFTNLAVAQHPAPKNRQILQDFRVDTPYKELKIPAATQRNVLSKVFRKYLVDENKCNTQFDAGNGADPLAAARKAGQIVPSIVDMASGSFTAPGQTQTVYLISVSECNASHADNFGTKRVAIFSGQQLVADLDVDFKSTIVKKTDLDGDGIEELLMTTGDMAQGTVIEMAGLVSFQNGRLRVIEDFGTVVEDDCASLRAGSSRTVSVLYTANAAPFSMPKLTMDNYRAGCNSKAKRWRFFKSGKMEE